MARNRILAIIQAGGSDELVHTDERAGITLESEVANDATTTTCISPGWHAPTSLGWS